MVTLPVGKKLILGYRVMLEPGVDLLRIAEIQKEIEKIDGVKCVEELSFEMKTQVERA